MWRRVEGSEGDWYYSVLRQNDEIESMDALRVLFPGGKANSLNLIVFSTSGVHGTYSTIEDAENFLGGKEEEGEGSAAVTFLVLHPRTVTLRYGICYPGDQDDIDFLKMLRKSACDAFVEMCSS